MSSLQVAENRLDEMWGAEGRLRVPAINLEFTKASYSPVEWIIVTR